MMGPEASGCWFFTQPTYRRLPPYVIFHAGGDQTVIRVVSEDRPHRPKVDHLAGLGLRGGGRSVNHRLPAETKLGHAHSEPRCTSCSRPPWTRCSTGSRPSSAPPAGRARPPGPVAGDRAADAEGLDRAQNRSTGCPSRVPGGPIRHPCRRPAAHLAALREWMLSYRPQELFDSAGAPVPSLVDWLPTGEAARSFPPPTRR